MQTLIHKNDCDQFEEVLNPGEQNSVSFTRIAGTGVTLHSSSGQAVFLTDEMVRELVWFQQHSLKREGH